MFATRNDDVPASEIRKIFNMIIGREDIVNMTVGIPDFDTPKHIKDAAKKAIDEGYTRYTHNAGLIEVREAMATKMKRDNGIDADPVTEVIATAGGMGALVLANLVLVDEGDEVLYPDPGFVSHYAHAKLAKGRPVPLQLMRENNFAYTAEEIEAALTDRTKVLIYNFPNNPTGGLVDREEMMKIADLAIKHDFYIISDEAYEQFRYDNGKPSFIGAIPELKDRVVSLFSMSKTYAMTGWRIGACVGPQKIIAAMTKLQEHLLAMPTSVSQKAAEAACAGPQDCVKEMLNTFRKRRELITKGLNAIEGVTMDPPGGAFYAFPDVSAYKMKTYDLVMKILEEIKVAVVHGTAFGKYGEGFIRLCYATSNETIEEALSRLDTFLPKLL
jgi:aspartate/methionine/tyrosine aminotransferase